VSASATTVRGEQRNVLWDVSWETYERLLAERGEAPIPRMTYDRGVLELMSPGRKHERLAHLITGVVLELAGAWGLDVTNHGAMTFKEAAWDRGFEPDVCLFVGAKARLAREADDDDPSTEPPPDVVVEIDISRSSIGKLDLFAQFGAGEVWRHDGGVVTFLVLEDGAYRPATASRAFPRLTAEALTELLADGLEIATPDWLRRIRDWADEA
jgi:Uma2 family endonuclease